MEGCSRPVVQVGTEPDQGVRQGRVFEQRHARVTAISDAVFRQARLWGRRRLIAVRTVDCQGTLTAQVYGRQHRLRCASTCLGGGIEPCLAHSANDDFGHNIARVPAHVHDLHAVMLRSNYEKILKIALAYLTGPCSNPDSLIDRSFPPADSCVAG